MEEEQEIKISKYNSGIAIQIRLDALWKDANNHSRLGLFSKWNNDLDTIWRELARDIKDKDFLDSKDLTGQIILGYKTRFKEVDEAVFLDGGFEDNANNGFEPITKEQLAKRDKQYKALSEKELFLKRLENFLGKGTAFEDEDEDSWS